MGHVVRDTSWCVLDIDTSSGRIFMQERWFYVWRVQPPLADWTYRERKAFHDSADRAIWAGWSNRTTLGVAGGSAFARRFRGRGARINLDIKWVTARRHWTVNVTKIPEGQFARSNVRWAARQINLDTNDVIARASGQVPVVHEFGHAAGNTSTLGRGDEYPAASPHVADATSMMHGGTQLRARHFQTIIDELNQMIPDTTFSVRSV
jgi:hypothetical protein